MINLLRIVSGLFYGMAWLIVACALCVSLLGERLWPDSAVTILLGCESPVAWLSVAFTGFLAWGFNRAADIEAGKRHPRR